MTKRRQGEPRRVNQMPHRIFEIDEILRVIVWYTRDVDTSEVTTVSLACCCKAFEEPALSLLWVRTYLSGLLHLFPSITTLTTDPTARPTEEEWKRFRRYALWIRVLSVNVTSGYATTQELTLLSLIATQQATTTVFPNVCGLTWSGGPSSLIHLPPFVSPILTDICVLIAPGRETEHFPEEYAPLAYTINSTISPSNLRSLSLSTSPRAIPSPELKRAIANLVLRCGSALTIFEVEFELPEPVVLHLMSLPNLKIWRTTQPTPTELLSSPLRPAVPFPQIESLNLRTATPQSWLYFINALVGTRSHPPHVSHIPAFSFANLTDFTMDPLDLLGCFDSCTFPLTDSDTSLLANTLPYLEHVWLGMPCPFNACKTTFRSLHSLSTRCPRLKSLCIHINMTTLVEDIRSLFEGGDQRTETQRIRPGPSGGRRSCPLDFRYAHRLPLEGNVGVGDLEVVAKGLFNISVTFTMSSATSDPNSKLWAKVSEGVKALHA